MQGYPNTKAMGRLEGHMTVVTWTHTVRRRPSCVESHSYHDCNSLATQLAELYDGSTRFQSIQESRNHEMKPRKCLFPQGQRGSIDSIDIQDAVVRCNCTFPRICSPESEHQAVGSLGSCRLLRELRQPCKSK